MTNGSIRASRETVITLEVNGTKLTLTIRDARALRNRLAGILAEQEKGMIGMVQAMVANEFQVSVKALTGHNRSRDTCTARFCAYWLCRQLGFGYRSIGQAFGGRHHASPMSGIERFENWMATEKKTRDTAERLRAVLDQTLKE